MKNIIENFSKAETAYIILSLLSNVLENYQGHLDNESQYLFEPRTQKHFAKISAAYKLQILIKSGIQLASYRKINKEYAQLAALCGVAYGSLSGKDEHSVGIWSEDFVNYSMLFFKIIKDISTSILEKEYRDFQSNQKENKIAFIYSIEYPPNGDVGPYKIFYN